MDIEGTPVGKNILLVEDIIDKGHTLDYLVSNLKTRNPESVRICVLLDKKEAREKEVAVDYICFDIQDKFVVGYGLDYREEYRNLPYIGVLKNG